MKLSFFIAVALISALMSSMALSSAHSVIAQRQTAMKTVGEQMKILGNMARIGGIYDDFFAQSAFEIMSDAVIVAQTNFQQQRASAEETRAKPSIWAAESDFNTRMDQFLADVNAAVAAEPADQARFVPLFAAVSQNCKSCHDRYRAPKN